MAIQSATFRRLLLTLSSLADLGPVIAGEQNFEKSAEKMLRLMMDVVGAREGALFTFTEPPAQLVAKAWAGFALFPQNGFIPLQSRQVRSLITAEETETLAPKSWEKFLSSNGNVAPELFKCLTPLRSAGKLAGLVALGNREGGASYEAEEKQALSTLGCYVALAVHNHNLSESLQHRVVENLRLVDSVHGFCDQTMEVFASAIDAKEYQSSGHSLRVGRYSAALASTLGMNSNDVAEIRAAGYLHDIGKVTIDKRLFSKASALEPVEFREIAEHTLVGHKILSDVQFPWPRIADVVRWHHERADGSGYPDHLRHEEIPLPARIIGIADTFDAMTHVRPYRESLSLGQTLSEIVRTAPDKYDGEIVQALLTCVRGAATGKTQGLLDSQAECTIGVADIDQLAADLKYKMSHGRTYNA